MNWRNKSVTFFGLIQEWSFRAKCTWKYGEIGKYRDSESRTTHLEQNLGYLNILILAPQFVFLAIWKFVNNVPFCQKAPNESVIWTFLQQWLFLLVKSVQWDIKYKPRGVCANHQSVCWLALIAMLHLEHLNTNFGKLLEVDCGWMWYCLMSVNQGLLHANCALWLSSYLSVLGFESVFSQSLRGPHISRKTS